MTIKKTSAQEAMIADRRKRFGKANTVRHAANRAAKADDLRARNAYRVAIGLPPVTNDDKHLMR